MEFDCKLHYRKSIRLRDYDYGQAGAYFITICTQNRECLFGHIVDDEMQLNDVGRIIQLIWNEITIHCPQVELDEFVILSNHVHGIISILEARLPAPTTCETQGAASSAPTLGKIMRRFKSVSAIAVNKVLSRSSQSLWQRNYWERIIRDEKELHKIREYIGNNPRQWEMDKLHP